MKDENGVGEKKKGQKREVSPGYLSGGCGFCFVLFCLFCLPFIL